MRLYLVKNVQGDGIEEILHNNSEDRALSGGPCDASCIRGYGHAPHGPSVQSVDCLQSSLSTLEDSAVTWE